MKKNFFPLIFLSAMIINVSSCSDDSSSNYSLSKKEIVINYHETSNIEVLPSSQGFMFSSENKYIAKVDDAGEVYGVLCGETFINVSNSKDNFSDKCKVTVVPTITAYREPCLNFGCSKEEVKAYEKRKIATETNDGITFYGENDGIYLIMYIFDNNKLSGLGLLFNTSSKTNTMEHLKQRYRTGYGEEGLYLISPDEKVGGIYEDKLYKYGYKYYRMLTLFPYKKETGGNKLVHSINTHLNILSKM